jgi:hypothetical protein
MLKLRHRNEWRGKCPRHPKQGYDDPGSVPASCEICHYLLRVRASDISLDAAEERAIIAIELEKGRVKRARAVSG